LQELDPRLISISVEVNGKIKTYDQNFSISAKGTKFANELQNEAEVTITNLNKEIANYILTETSPFNKNKTPKRVTVQAGRKSWGLTTIFVGDIASSIISQPPDTVLTLRCLTSNFDKGNLINRYQSQTSASQIARDVSTDLNTVLNFQATDKQISNYTFTGGALKQIGKLGEMGDYDAYIDDGVLVVKDSQVPLKERITIVNLNTGMIEKPEFTEQGIKVKFFLDGVTVLGGALRINSTTNPAVNGDYVIYKLGFDIASRETPFYWIAEALRK